jgi:hypothetical protein
LRKVELSSLEFKPAASASGTDSAFTYTVSDPGGNSAAGTAILEVAPVIPPNQTSNSLNPIALENERFCRKFLGWLRVPEGMERVYCASE